MRTTKFRAWDKELKMMRGVVEISFKGDGSFYGARLGKKGDDYITLAKDMILIEYTGLKDKNGKEIYEGDVVEFYTEISKTFPIESDEKYKPIGVWEWFISGFKWMSKSAGIGHGNGYKIIGNIYQNKELLK